MQLINIAQGNIIIKKVNGNLKIMGRLKSLGVKPMQKARVVFNTKSGVVLLVDNMQIALDKDICANIWVEKC